MYIPHHYRVDDPERQADLIRRNSLGLLINHGAGGLTANPIPFLLDGTAEPGGVLRCHMARANPLWQELQDGAECLVVFQDRDFYVTPSWYATKQEHGKVVPTWNYMNVHVWGVPRVIDDADWLQQQIRDLTDTHESPRAEPWAVDDAPALYVAAQVKGIIGLEISITRTEGKWKMSQNRPSRDRAGINQGLEVDGSPLAGIVDTD